MTWTFPTAPARPAAPASGTAITALIVGLAAAAIILSQVGLLLLSWWPSSPILWQLYFEVGRPLDLFYQLSSMPFGDIGLPAFTVLVTAASAICLGAVLSGRRLLQALAYHALVGVAAILCYGNAGVHDVAVLTLSAQSSRTVAVAAILFGLFPLLQCLRIHREYFAVAARTPSPERRRGLRAEGILRRARRAMPYRRSVKLADA